MVIAIRTSYYIFAKEIRTGVIANSGSFENSQSFPVAFFPMYFSFVFVALAVLLP